eukprot:gene26150-32683_t
MPVSVSSKGCLQKTANGNMPSMNQPIDRVKPHYHFQLASKYVRREIRSLTDEDREAFFDALLKVYTVPSAEGVALYGSKFKTAEDFLVKHLAGAGTTDCDHWHDGAGILTHHVAVTLEMEQSLQSIDPTLSMPYWEYGMDAYLYDKFVESPVFGKEWYGEANPLSSDHRINDAGRWSGIQLPDGSPYTTHDATSPSLNPFVNAYGALRSPWNNNPSPYIGRHNETYGISAYKSVPTCPYFQSCFQSKTLSATFNCLNGRTHGPVHIMIGGSWNEGDTLADSVVSFLKSPNKLLIFKVLWRMGITRCPEAGSCSTENAKGCRCAVPQEYIDKYTPSGVLEMAGLISAYSKLQTASDETLLKVIRALEDP